MTTFTDWFSKKFCSDQTKAASEAQTGQGGPHITSYSIVVARSHIKKHEGNSVPTCRNFKHRDPVPVRWLMGPTDLTVGWHALSFGGGSGLVLLSGKQAVPHKGWQQASTWMQNLVEDTNG